MMAPLVREQDANATNQTQQFTDNWEHRLSAADFTLQRAAELRQANRESLKRV
jgi:hypothetical protein